MIRLSIAIVFFLTASSFADTRALVEDFSTIEQKDTGTTAVWNLSKKALHVPFVIDRSKGLGGNPAAPAQEDDFIDSGSGKDGEFRSGRYDLFDLNHGLDPSKVTLDTSRIYEFTDFDLASGVTLSGTGSNALRIRVQGDASVVGTIDLAGSNGASAAMGGPGTAGLGGAGGRNGGAGAAAPGGSANGVGAMTGGGGAKGGDAAAGSAGGGGGGGHKSSGVPSPGVGGLGGAAYGSDYLSPIAGGSGGGGGGFQTTQNASGGGGGGGGGALDFHVTGNLVVAGHITANGGVGGALGGTLGGAGGGGSGGALRFLLGGTYTNNALIDAVGGAGGTGLDGTGSDGRIYVGNESGSLAGTGSESPTPPANPLGQSFYSTASYDAFTKTYDTLNSRPHYLAVDVEASTPGGSTAEVEIAGSDDAFASDDTGFVPITALAQLEGKRYFRLHAKLQSTSRTNTPQITRITTRYEERTQANFTFGWKGCARVSPRTDRKESDSAIFSILSVLFLFLISVGPVGARVVRRKLSGREC